MSSPAAERLLPAGTAGATGPGDGRRKPARLLSLDLLRGAIMVVMAWDHSVDVLADGKLPKDGGFQAWSGHLATYDGNGGLFLARFVSHFCAPGFFYTMGVGMVLFSMSRRDRGWSWGRIVRHFCVRASLLLLIGRLVDVPFYVGLLASLYEGRTVEHRGTTFTPADTAKAWYAAWIGIFEVMTGLAMVMAATSLLLPLLLRESWRGVNLCREPAREGEEGEGEGDGEGEGGEGGEDGGEEGVAQRRIGLWEGGPGQWYATVLGVALLALSNAVIVHYQAGNPEAAAGHTPPPSPPSPSPSSSSSSFSSGITADTWPRMGAHASDWGGVLLRFVHVPGYGLGHMGAIAYPLVPWISVTLFGVSAGAEFRAAPALAHERSRSLGALLLLLFLLLRCFGGAFGNLRGWPRGDGYAADGVSWAGVPLLIEFFNVCKYPPSPAYVSLTLGVDLLALWFFSRAQVLLLAAEAGAGGLAAKAAAAAAARQGGGDAEAPSPQQQQPGIRRSPGRSTDLRAMGRAANACHRADDHDDDGSSSSSSSDDGDGDGAGGDAWQRRRRRRRRAASGPSLLCCLRRAADCARASWKLCALRALLVFGRVPLFFYVLHFWVYAGVRLLMATCLGVDGVPLPAVLPLYLAALVLLFFACRRYGAFKSSTPPESLWRFL